MIHSHGDESSIGRIEYIDVQHCGQAFKLGRYCLHFHMIGDVSKSYIRGNTVRHSNNRAVAIHGVNYLKVQDNVAYDIMGHTYFIEDGAETKNVIEHNLGVLTRISSSLLETDTSPATFWVNLIINRTFTNKFRLLIQTIYGETMLQQDLKTMVTG